MRNSNTDRLHCWSGFVNTVSPVVTICTKGCNIS